MNTKISIEEYDTIVDLYQSGLSKEKIQKIYGVSNSVIDRIFKIKGVVCRDNSHKCRKYTVDEHYFDTIDTANKAYILGLLYADGTNYTPNRMIKIELQERDKRILEDINKELGSNRPIYCNRLHDKNPNHQNTYGLIFVNKLLSTSLERQGMVRNKSLILQFPSGVPDELMSHFIRGCMDGDGHIEWNKTHFINIASSKDFCDSLQTYLLSKLSISSSIYDTSNKNSNTKVLHIFQKEQIKKFLDWIYQDAELYIQRKFDTYQSIVCSMNS